MNEQNDFKVNWQNWNNGQLVAPPGVADGLIQLISCSCRLLARVKKEVDG